MAKLMVLKKGEPIELIDLPAELIGTPEAPLYRPTKAKKASEKEGSSGTNAPTISKPKLAEPEPEPEPEPVDDLDDLSEAALRARYKKVVGSPAGNRTLDTMRAAIREALATDGG